MLVRSRQFTSSGFSKSTFALGAVLAAAGFAETTRAQETIYLPGIVRDFEKTNTNFAVTPSGGNGHYAGNISLTLSGENRPIFDGIGGFKVNNQWRNSAGEPIPPHLYASGGPAGGIVNVVSLPTINNNPTIDSFDSADGPYGGVNVSPAPQWVANSAMPAVAAPSPLPALINDILYPGNSTSTLSVNRHCKTFTLQNNHILQISGNIFIYCTETFKIENYATLTLLPNATLTVYIGKDCTIQNNVNVNVNTYTPSRMKFINLGNSTMVLEDHAELYAQIISPNAMLHVKNNCDFCGTFTGKSAIIDNFAGFHNDMTGTAAPSVCTVQLNDAAGTQGLASSGGIASDALFAHWYKDTPGVNLSTVYTIGLVKNVSGVYEYLNDAFHPIDNQLFGNQDQAHNNYFTYAIEVPFVHHACAETPSFFEFEGADDAWMFIDGDLAMDLGGILPSTSQYVEIDRMGVVSGSTLVDGQTYTMHFFYAQRQPNMAVFRMRTNLDLKAAESLASVSASWD